MIIRVKNLGVSFNGTVILSDVSFTALKGEITVLLGASGCGKSTVMKQLLNLFPVQKGTVCVLGKDLSVVSEAEQQELYLKMGVFYQNGALLNSLTVGENVALPLEQHSNLPESIITDIVRMKLGLVHLSHAYHLYPSELSGGMLKRAALARAVALDPPLLFCDEPGAGFDPISLESLDRLVVNLKEQLGISVVMVTHEVSSILRIADRIVFIDGGVVPFEGTPSQALESDVERVRNFFAAAKDAKRIGGGS